MVPARREAHRAHPGHPLRRDRDPGDRVLIRRPPVLLVHGFDGHGAKDCRELAPLKAAFGRRALVVGYYAGDTHADVTVADETITTDTSIDVIAGRLAALAATLGTVDLVGHSMGGLVVAAALPHLQARRVALVGVPLQGLPSAVGTDVAQCREMSPGSPWLSALAESGWTADLVVGSEADEAVPVESALAAPRALRTVRIPADAGVHHGDLVTDPRVLRVLSSRRPPREPFR